MAEADTATTIPRSGTTPFSVTPWLTSRSLNRVGCGDRRNDRRANRGCGWGCGSGCCRARPGAWRCVEGLHDQRRRRAQARHGRTQSVELAQRARSRLQRTSPPHCRELGQGVHQQHHWPTRRVTPRPHPSPRECRAGAAMAKLVRQFGDAEAESLGPQRSEACQIAGAAAFSCRCAPRCCYARP